MRRSNHDQAARSHGCSIKLLAHADLVGYADQLKGLGGRIEESDAISKRRSTDDQAARNHGCSIKLLVRADLVGYADQLKGLGGRIKSPTPSA